MVWFGWRSLDAVVGRKGKVGNVVTAHSSSTSLCFNKKFDHLWGGRWSKIEVTQIQAL